MPSKYLLLRESSCKSCLLGCQETVRAMWPAKTWSLWSDVVQPCCAIAPVRSVKFYCLKHLLNSRGPWLACRRGSAWNIPQQDRHQELGVGEFLLLIDSKSRMMGKAQPYPWQVLDACTHPCRCQSHLSQCFPHSWLLTCSPI